MANTQLFREAALKRLSNPEQLDRVLHVTTFKGWLATSTLTTIAAAVLFWSIEGEISTYVNAHGILLNRGGEIVDTSISGTGTLIDVVVSVGDRVQQGDIIAEAVNREALERYRSALALVEEREELVENRKATLAAENELFTRNLALQRTRLEELERGGREQLETARDTLESHLQLYQEHVVTRLTVERSQQAFDRAQRALFDTLRQLDDLEIQEIRHRGTQENRLSEVEVLLQAAERNVNELKTLVDTQQVLAPVTGRITEIKATVGAVLRPGQPVASIETGSERLEALVYIPATEGKQVEQGMDVLVSPSTVRREEYGAIRGTVESVSAFPVTLEGMVAVLQNRGLAEAIANSGPPYASRITLTLDPSTASGFAWSSPKASEETLSSGTLAQAEVKVETQSPISMVVPLIKETFGL